MGYDFEECLRCYTNDYWNNPVDDDSNCEICIGCLDTYMHDVHGRVPGEIKHKCDFSSGTCEFCNKPNRLLITVSMCDECLTFIKKHPISHKKYKESSSVSNE